MAVIGQSLPTPEEGWQRVNCGAQGKDNRFKFTGVWTYISSGSGYYGGDCVSARPADNPGEHCTIEFNFIGTKLRIMMQTHPDRCRKADVYIDGVPAGTYTISAESIVDMALLYEKTGLLNKTHYVKIYGDDPEHGINIDCIDIDAEGEVPQFKEPERYILQENESYKTIIGTKLITLENQSLTIENVLANGFYDPEQIREVYNQLYPSFKLLRYAMASANDAIKVASLPEAQVVKMKAPYHLSGYSFIKQIILNTVGTQTNKHIHQLDLKILKQYEINVIRSEETQGIDVNTVLLMHFENDISDSAKGKEFTMEGTPVVSKEEKRFGKGSLKTTGGYLSGKKAGDKDFCFGREDWTVDWWEYRLSGKIYGGIFAVSWGIGTGIYNDSLLLGYVPGAERVCAYGAKSRGAWDLFSGCYGGIVKTNQWTHRAVVRKEDVLISFENGKVISSEPIAGESLYWSEEFKPIIGAWITGAAGYMDGYIDELRVSKGVARWTENFIPPERPYGTFMKLIKSEKELYTVVEGSLKKAEIKEPLKKEDFEEYGFWSALEGKTLEEIKALKNPQLLIYDEANTVHSLLVEISEEIKKIDAKPLKDEIRMVFSFDRGKSWKNYAEGWQPIECTAEAISGNGMTVETINGIKSEQWATVDISSLQIAFCLLKSSLENDRAIDSLTITGNTASWDKAGHMTDYDYAYPNTTTLAVKLLTDGNYKINRME